MRCGLGLGLAHWGLGLAGLVLCCETRSCYARRHNDFLKHTATFQVLFIVSLFCAWNITTVKINSGVHLLKRCQVPLFTSGGLSLGLDILVLVLRIWSCLHHYLTVTPTITPTYCDPNLWSKLPLTSNGFFCVPCAAFSPNFEKIAR